ncbi:mediator of RNA polymerase II transcription subunit 4-like isoform X2 [Lytechinus variegatus]|uniref:mediator of RNA polymerase II transcription subunit 4-like isoform X2 n=1 Tax=Lytechinus variegatus TaxID=7654 RepID=UPI001BB1FDEC|nr:mediator of RNA polymerase II transcription subunit 4-like isoform X2 [Lytechinus variegatus]
MAASMTAKSRLLSLVEEAEVLTKDLGEATSAVRQRVPHPDEPQIMEILMKKNEELEATLKETEEQRKMKQEIEGLQEEVDKRDEDIKTLQKQLKEAEYILATAIYQAKEKLKAIKQAKKGAISSEELIKYAHRISATNAVAAPLTWEPGDPRRPYPTDLEMRMGILGRLSNLPQVSQNGAGGDGAQSAAGATGGLTWKPSSELTASRSMSTGVNRITGDAGIDLNVPGHGKENEDDVEMMSSDSESSSSSDSF